MGDSKVSVSFILLLLSFNMFYQFTFRCRKPHKCKREL